MLDDVYGCVGVELTVEGGVAVEVWARSGRLLNVNGNYGYASLAGAGACLGGLKRGAPHLCCLERGQAGGAATEARNSEQESRSNTKEAVN